MHEIYIYSFSENIQYSYVISNLDIITILQFTRCIFIIYVYTLISIIIYSYFNVFLRLFLKILNIMKIQL